MADNLQNTSKVDTNITSKAGLVTDLNPQYLSEQNYLYARNAVRNTKEGDLGTISNEPSNVLCFEAPYKIIGHIELPDNKLLIFSTNNIQSEIGIGDPTLCSYTKLLNLNCLNFNDGFPITGIAKKDFQKGVIATFTDKRNPIRRIELKTISSVTNCDDILLFKKIDHPCLTLKKGQVGNVPNGMYSIAIAYVIDNQVFSDYYSITNRIALYSETNANSIDVSISGLDSEFDQFAVIVVGNYIDPVTKGVTKVAKKVATLSTKVHSFSITDFINTTYAEIPLSSLLIQKRTWQKAGIITSNSNYLLLGDLVGRDEENYQLKAMSIRSEYVVTQVPADYYEVDGIDVTYYRDENYDFYIQGVYNTGELTDKYHIPGPVPDTFQSSPVSSPDVYEYDTQFSDCDPKTKIPRYQVENTAGKMIPTDSEFVCDRREIGTGTMGVFLSTNLYPDNLAMFGEWANTPIRFHKMPDECKVPRFEYIDGKAYINIIGVRFKDIPMFDSPDIVGYKITRSDRKGGNGTIAARGLMTNIRHYTDISTKQLVLYSNYTVNDLSPDQYLSSTQTVFKNNKENNYTPLTDFYLDKFSFYSPHTLFEPRYSLGTEVKIESEEIATIKGHFELVYKHPREKLMNQFSFWLSAAVGFIESVLTLAGKSTHVQQKQNVVSALGVSSGSAQVFVADKTYPIRSVEDLVGLDIVGFIQSKILALDTTAFSAITAILTVLASLAIKIPYSVLNGIQEAEKTMDLIRNFTGYTNYVYQYNAAATFDRSICQPLGQKRRRLLRPATYIPPTVVSIDDKIYNNLNRERSVYLELNKPIPVPKTKDDSRQTASGFGICDDITKETTSTGSAFYATSKVVNPNQYGQLGSSSPVAMHSCRLQFNSEVSNPNESPLTVSPVLFGGDCIITRFQFLKKMPFFSQNIANTGFSDGTEYDYRKYRNIGFTRFWIDSTKYDFSELLSGNRVNYARFSRTTSSKHNLDCKGGDKKNILRIDDAYMYLSNNCAVDFFCEADYNVDFRQPQVNGQLYYSKNNKNVSEIFRSDRLNEQEEFIISRAYNDLYTTEIFAQQQRDDFDPTDPIPVEQPNSVIYSLPSFNLQEVDNWQYFLPVNYFAFRESDYGSLTSMHKLDQDRLIFLFSKSSPYISMGRDFLELEQSGRKVTIGDGGLFAQDPREIMPTDNNYGACNSRYAFSNTHLGRFYPSATQGRILNYTDNLDDITRQGMSYWCKNYMPIQLYKYFPTYIQVENPVSGVGYLTVFDSFTETIYITKRDFSPVRELSSQISYSEETNQFTYKGDVISLRDSRFFNDISWTLSYCPVDKAFVSWHDWHPDWVIQRDNHFLSVKDRGVWKHNEAYNSFCTYYTVQHPFEIGFVSSSGQTVHTVRSLEYFLEVYHYKNFGRDRFHLLNENFDALIVKNTEQISPLLYLNHSTGNPENDLAFPIKSTTDPVAWNVLFNKEENKYRVNQFWDATRDRGEFSSSESHLFPTDESGYKSVINPLGINVDKPEEERKKFRHYFNEFRLIKTASGPSKFICKLYNIKKLVSLK